MPDDDKTKPKTFTQEELNAKVEERLKREREKFADYDELKAIAAKAKDADEKTKSEQQKLLDRIEAAEKKADEAEKRAGEVEAESLRLRVAADKGLTPAQAKRLTGSTREELEADADDLLETFPAPKSGDDDSKDKGGRIASRPREDLRGGGKPDETPVETNPAKLAESVPRY